MSKRYRAKLVEVDERFIRQLIHHISLKDHEYRKLVEDYSRIVVRDEQDTQIDTENCYIEAGYQLYLIEKAVDELCWRYGIDAETALPLTPDALEQRARPARLVHQPT